MPKTKPDINCDSRLKLKSFSYIEKEEFAELKTSKIELDDLNLFIGNNGQGKTRLIRFLAYFKNLFLNATNQNPFLRLSTTLEAKFKFINSNNVEIDYKILIVPNNEGNRFEEELTQKDLILLSTGTKMKLYDEVKKEHIDKFFVPVNIPNVAAIRGEQFQTINMIRNFFQSILVLDATKNKDILIDKQANIINSEATNLSSVLYNWSKSKSNIFNELVNDFTSCFKIIQELDFKKLPINFEEAYNLFLREKEVKKDIALEEWSNGFSRMLSLLVLPKTQFEFNKKMHKPSLICIDEIENGLDFKTLKYIIDYIKDYIDDIQFILTSHSPSISEFIHPRNWQVVKRSGSNIKVTKPIIVEKDFDEKLEYFKQQYWDFYVKHVSESENYEP